jgi:hypothetical protein
LQNLIFGHRQVGRGCPGTSPSLSTARQT